MKLYMYKTTQFITLPNMGIPCQLKVVGELTVGQCNMCSGSPGLYSRRLRSCLANCLPTAM